MDCVVTGGAGFIGSNLVDALVARGDRVAVIDDLSSGKRENLTRSPRGRRAAARLDVRDAPGCGRSLCPDAAAARLPPGRADRRAPLRGRPAPDAEINVLGAINVLSAARESAPRRVVNTSTGGGLYGDAELLPTPEDQPVHPLAPYGQSKYAAEGYFELYARLYGLSTVSLRYGNVYGPRQDVHGEAGVVAIFCGCLLEGTTPQVFGDGRQTRDWVDVADVVSANLLAADSQVTGPINIAGGEETSVLDLVQALGDVGAATRAGVCPPPSSCPREPARSAAAASTSRAPARSSAGVRPSRFATGLTASLADLL